MTSPPPIRPRALWFTEPGQAILREEPAPAPVGDDVCEIRSLYSGVSAGSERLVFQGKVPAALHQSMRVPYMGGDFSFPVKYGYSLVGVVEQGPAELQGKTVHLLHPHQNRCQVAAGDVFSVPVDVPSDRAALASNLETAVNAMWDARPVLGERVLVVGFGFIGALIAYLVRHIPGIDLQVIEPDVARRNFARSLGYAADPPGTKGKPFDLAFHTSGSAVGLQEAVDRVGLEGRVMEVSWFGDALTALRLGGTFHSQRKSILATQVSSLPGYQTPRWDRVRRKQLVFSLLRDPEFDSLIYRIDFESLPEFFNHPRPDCPGLIPIVTYA